MHAWSLEEIIERERPRNRRERVLKVVYLLTPIVATAAILAVIWVVSGPGRVGELATYAATSFFVLGKLIILKGITSEAMGPFDFALLVLYMDLAVASFLTFNLDYAYRVPYLGERLEGLQEHGRQVLLEKPWLGRLTWLGIALFVMFPLTGTGAVGGSIFGRLVGLGRYWILSGILTGSAIGCLAFAVLGRWVAALLPEQTRTSWWFEAVGVAIVALLIGWLWLRSRRVEHERRSRSSPPGEPLGAREGGT